MKFRPLNQQITAWRAIGFLAALALTSACSGADKDQAEAGGLCTDTGKSEQDLCPTASERPTAERLLDDLEDANGLIPTVQGRSGSWWTAGDETSGATMLPVADAAAPPEAIPEGRCGSKFGMRVTGQGFLDWGSLLGIDLVYGERTDGTMSNLPYDASAYSGIEFWARIGDTSTDRVRFAVSDVNNEPYGGVCDDNGDADQKCFDTFGTYLNGLSTDWRHYRIPFAGLTRRQFGFPASAAATDALFSVQFNFDPTSIFDLWVDDVAFY